MEFKEEVDSDEEALSPLSHLSLNEEGDDGDETGAWDKEGDGGDGDNSQKISKKDALPLVIQWIKENYEASGNSCIPKHLVYQHYKDFCEDNNIQFTNMANFGKIIRSVFPRLKTRRLGPRGKTKHHYHGISISSASKLQVPADAIITGKKAQNRRVRGPDVTASPPKRQRRAHKLMEDGLDFPDYPEDGEQFMRRPIPALPSFDLEEIAFMGEVSDTLIQQLRHFMSLYKQHAQHLLSVLCSCSFTEVESLLVTFWSQNFGDFQEVFLREDIINHITSKDRLIYSLALDFFFPTLFEPQVKSLIESLIHLSQHIRAWMEKATQHFPPAFSARKLHEVKRFALNLRKRSRINLLAQQARECLEWSIMLVDWIGIEFDIIQDKTFMLFSSNASNSVPHYITATITEDLRGMLEDHCNLDQFVTWMRLVADELVEQGALPAPEKLSESIYRAQTFLFCWAQYTSLIMCDLTCRDAPSLEFFHALFTFLNAYVSYYMEGKVMQYKMAALYPPLPRPIPHQTNTSPVAVNSPTMRRLQNMPDMSPSVSSPSHSPHPTAASPIPNGVAGSSSTPYSMANVKSEPTQPHPTHNPTQWSPMPPHGMYHGGEEAEGNEDQEGDNESGLTPLDLEALQNMTLNYIGDYQDGQASVKMIPQSHAESSDGMMGMSNADHSQFLHDQSIDMGRNSFSLFLDEDLNDLPPLLLQNVDADITSLFNTDMGS